MSTYQAKRATPATAGNEPNAKTCIREGCCRPARSRGMCNSHYTTWRRKTPVSTARVMSTDRVIEAMEECDGTYRQLAAKTGQCYDTVRLAVNALHAQKLIHVSDVLPPTQTGGKWVNVYALGAGEDVKVSSRTKRAEALRGRRIRHAVMRAPRHVDPLVVALFGRRAASMNAEG